MAVVADEFDWPVTTPTIFPTVIDVLASRTIALVRIFSRSATSSTVAPLS